VGDAEIADDGVPFEEKMAELLATLYEQFAESVRELNRQIGSLYYERSGLSENKEKPAELVQAGTEKNEPKLAVRDPYIFEFLGIKSREVMRESDLEDQLLNKLQDFLMELGYGFCFEARRKRILIGDTHGFVDLVFYHRILKCHVLLELKVESFNHENLGQLNTYVSWYRKHMMADGDTHLFVSKYQLEVTIKRNSEVLGYGEQHTIKQNA